MKYLVCLLQSHPTLQTLEYSSPTIQGGLRDGIGRIVSNCPSTLRNLDLDIRRTDQYFVPHLRGQPVVGQSREFRRLRRLQRLAIPWTFIITHPDNHPAYPSIRGPPFEDVLPELLEVLVLRHCDVCSAALSEALLRLLRNRSKLRRLKRLKCVRLQAYSSPETLHSSFESVLEACRANKIDCAVDTTYVSSELRFEGPNQPVEYGGAHLKQFVKSKLTRSSVMKIKLPSEAETKSDLPIYPLIDWPL